MRFIRCGLAVLGFLAVAGSAQAAAIRSEPGRYAEGIYAEYAAGTGQQIAFDVKTTSAGRLVHVADVPFGQLLAASDHQIDAAQVGTELRNPHFMTPYPGVFESAEMHYTAAGFEALGYPVAAGVYRMLHVTAIIGPDIKSHQAVEFCWPSLGHCALLDPTVIFAQSMVENRLRLAVEGWKKVIEEQTAEVGISAVCGLASNPSIKDRKNTWGAYWIEYKDIYGITLVHKDLGGQQSGIRCNTSCQPAPYGYSYVSSCQSFLGWNCACDNDFGYGTTGTSGKWIAETKCTHKFAVNAAASATVFNQGTASVSISWTMDGSPDANGGQIMDTCGYY